MADLRPAHKPEAISAHCGSLVSFADMPTYDSRQLEGQWLHAHEEDADDCSVFRPGGTPLGPSRGRSAYEFHADGRVSVSGPGPDDRRRAVEGSYALAPDGTLTIKVAGRADEVMQVQSLDSDRLVVKR
ncbi:hypothetical protein [Paraburkholderia antibiotica]|uniref:Lipocalin-like domain-containing protein n=1 Tax=Paraburkholderia antibiotica TaxID=2728839 RepID=A0A7X9ZZD1_9BURK|nr:hypothetical protein [Paraburkholderia antibiotica]NML32755.1 hypothetical protein [Paraburkholderia antibiotica]